MEAELWQRLPEDLLSMVLARLPMRVLGKMRTVCKQWNYLLSSRDALQRIVPNWSLHSTLGFLIQFQWDFKDDVESCWVCVIFFARVVVAERLCRACGGVRGGRAPRAGVRGQRPREIFFGPTYFRRFRDDIFLGPHDIRWFSAHGFCRWFSISG
jgi:hypothetical protein